MTESAALKYFESAYFRKTHPIIHLYDQNRYDLGDNKFVITRKTFILKVHYQTQHRKLQIEFIYVLSQPIPTLQNAVFIKLSLTEIGP